MKLTPLNPLAYMAAVAGMTRPLDKNDFKGGHIPDCFGHMNPNPGFLKGLRWGGDDPYRALCTNAGILTGDDASGQDTWNTNVVTTTQRHPLGTIAISKDGRVFRYASAGATDLVVGNILQSAVPIPNHLALTSAAQNIGDGYPTPIVVTPGATAGAANLYAEGTLMVDTAPSNGYTHRISGHAAITASVAFNLYLDQDEKVQVAFTTATRYGLHHNPYKTVLQSPTTATALTVGGAVAVITGNGTAENYGWIQTRGPFCGLINGTPAVGTALIISATTAGALDVATFTTTVEVSGRFIARAMQVGVSTKNNSVFLLLD
jgi:hypothetical protein